MSDLNDTQKTLQSRLEEAEQLVRRYRGKLRRDLLLWIVASTVLGTVIGYAIALWLVDPVIIVACEGIQV